jgi:hypothetical protein
MCVDVGCWLLQWTGALHNPQSTLMLGSGFGTRRADGRMVIPHFFFREPLAYFVSFLAWHCVCLVLLSIGSGLS